MKRTALAFVMLVLCLLATVKVSLAQDYLGATGNPSFGVNIPVENGFINITNGNLHLEFPLATHAQRGALKLNERLVYDSRIWTIVQYDNYYWWPTNIPNAPYTQGGWRFVNGMETGTLSSTTTQVNNHVSCIPSDPAQGMHYYNTQYKTVYTWADPSGTSHPFDIAWHTITNICDTLSPQPESGSGWATDGSGYQITLAGDNQDAPTNISITDSNGTQVYPGVADRYGNYWSSDSNGNLIDDLGRIPVIVTTNGNVTYYDVLAPNGPINNNGTRVRYTVNTAPVQVNTDFNQPVSGSVAEWSGTLNPVQSIDLPDGSSYSFTYDSYGEMASVTLPTGGAISYGWSNYLDSYQNVNRWLTQRTVGTNSSMTFTPSVITQCSSGGTGCQEQVRFHEPSADETVYQLTLNNGAWNTNVTYYNGLASSGTPLVNVVNTYDFSNTCTSGACVGAEYIKKSTALTTLLDNGLTTQTQYLYGNPELGKLTGLLQWDYYTGTPSTTPTRETDYVYTGFDLTSSTLLDSSRNQAAQTTYGYTSTAAVTTSGVPQHGTASGPYLRTISQWINTGGQLTTTYGMDDTGMVTSVTGPNRNQPTTIAYQCSNALQQQVTNALGQPTAYVHDCNSGAILKVTDPNGSGTVYNYEPIVGRLQSINYPDGGQTNYSYPSPTEVDTGVLATPDPTITTQDISDSFGRPYQHIQAGASNETTYDSNGRVSCVTNPHFSTPSSTDGSTCVTSYDGLDRPKSETEADGSTLTWSYSGNSVTSFDELGNSWQRTSDAFGRLTNVTEPTGASTTYGYSTGGGSTNVTVTQNGVGGETARVRSFSYDSLSRIVTETNPEMGTTSYDYDANGNLNSQTDARGITTNYTYDVTNRVTDKTFTGGQAPAQPTPGQHFRYDQTSNWAGSQSNTIGRLSQAFTDVDQRFSTYGFTGTYEWTDELYSYDAMGRQIHIATAFPSEAGWAAHGATLAYDLSGDLTSLTYPDGRLVTQTWDGAGHIQSVSFSGYNYLSSASYWPDGSPHTMTFANGITQTVNKNPRLQPTEISALANANGLNQTVFDKQYSFTSPCQIANNGNIMQVIDAKNNDQSQGFCYDSLNRIASFSTGDGTMTQSYSMDSFGNMSQSGTLNFQGGYDSNNRINLPGYIYDQAGNLTNTNIGGVTSTYAFDAENKLFDVNGGGGFYTYDAAGERMRKDTAGGFTEYQYLNGQPIAEKNADGTWSDYIYANGQKIAQADAFDIRIHTHGTAPTTGTAAGWPIAGGVGYIIQTGDKLCWRQFQSNGNGGPYVQFTDSTSTVSVSVPDGTGQQINALWTQGTWVQRVVDMSSFAGKTVSLLAVLVDGSTPAGDYDIYYGDMAFVSTNGTVTPIYDRQMGTSFPNFYNPGGQQTNLAAYEEKSLSMDPVSTHYYAFDHLGSARMVLSTGGWPISSDTFYPFGQEQSPTSDPNHYKFTGLERDSESALDHAMYRQYSSSAGRWMSPDPYLGSMDFANPQSLNRYAYVGNSPLNFTDPSGLLSCNSCGGPDVGSLLGTLIVDGIESLFHMFSGPSFSGSLAGRPNGVMLAPGTYDDPGAVDPNKAYLYAPGQLQGQVSSSFHGAGSFSFGSAAPNNGLNGISPNPCAKANPAKLNYLALSFKEGNAAEHIMARHMVPWSPTGGASVYFFQGANPSNTASFFPTVMGYNALTLNFGVVTSLRGNAVGLTMLIPGSKPIGFDANNGMAPTSFNTLVVQNNCTNVITSYPGKPN